MASPLTAIHRHRIFEVWGTGTSVHGAASAIEILCDRLFSQLLLHQVTYSTAIVSDCEANATRNGAPSEVCVTSIQEFAFDSRSGGQ
jgi:hypothetical protein